MNVLEGYLNAEGIKVCVVASRFNNFLVDELIKGAVDCFIRHGGKEENIDIVRTPGAWEIPVAVKRVVSSDKYQAIVALGVLIRGETPHFDYIASEVTKGIASVSIETGVPVTYGIITADDLTQAIERAGTKQGNKGWDAMLSAIEMVNLLKKI